MIADVHADAISTFWDDGRLVLGAMADTPENHTRYDPESTWFHLDDDAKFAGLPAGFEFVAPQGTPIWFASETQDPAILWPGFSSQSVPRGVLDDEDITLTLESVTGPGDVELWTSDVFGMVGRRLWSSDEDFTSFVLDTNTHVHANWAFTEPGTYELTVRASASVAGSSTSDTATYTFVVGGLPDDVGTTTTLETSATSILVGDDLELTAAVAPPSVQGYVEFRDGTTVLGHEEVVEGEAALTTDALPVGTHSLTAAFVPKVENLADGSNSAETSVTVTDGSGAEFGIAGVDTSYQVGDVLDARVVGHTLADGQSYRWSIRPVGVTTGAYVFRGTGDEWSTGRVTQVLDMAYDNYEIRADVRQGTTTVSSSPWVALNVENAVEPISGSFPVDPMLIGDDNLLELSGRDLAPGESIRLAYRFSYDPWWSAEAFTRMLDEDTVQLMADYAMKDTTWVFQVIRDGLVAAQSEPIVATINAREALVEGVRSVYRVGQTLKATATVFPDRPGLTYRWSTWSSETGMQTIKEGTDAASLELPMTMDYDGKQLMFAALATYPNGGNTVTVASDAFVLEVSDSDPDTQLLFFQGLSDHYHQGGNVNLQLVADPALADGDTITWQWRWPGTEEWTTMPGASGLSHPLVAEQALDGVQVRGSLDFAGSDDQLTSDPVTIHVDDHGSPPRQQLTVAGETNYVAGQTATLTAKISAPTVLTGYQWYAQRPGDDQPRPIDGATEAQHVFTARAEDGAELSVAVTRPDGTVAYGPSVPVTLAVSDPPSVENAVRPTVTGTAKVGASLAASTGAWSPAAESVEYQWLADGAPIAGATGASLVLTPAQRGTAVSVEVTARTAGHQPGVARSAPTAPVAAADLTTTTVSAAPVRQVYGRTALVEVAVAPATSGVVTATFGATSVSSELASGTATLTLPARALPPGRWSVAISYAGAAGSTAPSTGLATVTVAKAAPRVRLVPVRTTVVAGAVAPFRVIVTADGVDPSGKVTVRMAGTARTVRLKEGRALVRVSVPAATKPGRTTASVVYAGDRFVGSDKRRSTKVTIARRS